MKPAAVAMQLPECLFRDRHSGSRYIEFLFTQISLRRTHVTSIVHFNETETNREFIFQ